MSWVDNVGSIRNYLDKLPIPNKFIVTNYGTIVNDIPTNNKFEWVYIVYSVNYHTRSLCKHNDIILFNEKTYQVVPMNEKDNLADFISIYDGKPIDLRQDYIWIPPVEINKIIVDVNGLPIVSFYRNVVSISRVGNNPFRSDIFDFLLKVIPEETLKAQEAYFSAIKNSKQLQEVK